MMRSMKIAATLTLLIALVAGAALPAAAARRVQQFPHMVGAPDAVFYEVTESMKLISKRHTGFRVATSALRGTVVRGTPFCPDALLRAYGVTKDHCDLVAIGSDRIDLTTGLGTFEASIDIIIDGDNPTDGPEFVIGTIKVSGNMDFSPAVVFGLPFGTIRGRVHGEGQPVLFSGTFRLPFAVRGMLLYLDTIDGQPKMPVPQVIPIEPGELSLTLPLVRFEVWFD